MAAVGLTGGVGRAAPGSGGRSSICAPSLPCSASGTLVVAVGGQPRDPADSRWRWPSSSSLLLRNGEIAQNAAISLWRLAVSYLIAGCPRHRARHRSWASAPCSTICWTRSSSCCGRSPASPGSRSPSSSSASATTLPIFIMAYVRALSLPAEHHRRRARRPIGRCMRAARTMGVGQGTILRHVILPSALPQILTGARIAGGSVWMALVAAELIGAPSGLGFAIEWYRELLMTPKVIAFIIVISVLGYLTDRALARCSAGSRPGPPASERAVSGPRLPLRGLHAAGGADLDLAGLGPDAAAAQPRAPAGRRRGRGRRRPARQRRPADGPARRASARVGAGLCRRRLAGAVLGHAHGLSPGGGAQSRPDRRELPPGGAHRPSAARHPLVRHRHAGRRLHRRLRRLLSHDHQHDRTA